MLTDKITEWCTAHGRTIEPGRRESIGYRELAGVLKVGQWSVRQALREMRGNSPRTEHLGPVEEHRLKSEVRQLRERVQETLAQQVLDQRYQEFVSEVASLPRNPPAWTYALKPGRPKQAMPVAHLSDAHFDERVDPKQVNYLNAYDRRIATERLHRFFSKTISLCDDYLKGVDYPGIVLCVSGDMFSGQIHEELRETNEAPLCASFAYWIDPMYAGIRMLAERFGRVYVPWVVGNHPRLSPKPRAKGGVEDNFDWLLGAMLQRDFARAADKRVSFSVAESYDLSFRIYQTAYLATHGDQFRGGSGIAAELSPMMIGDARKRERQQAVDEPYDVMVMGHWHRRICLERIKANGSLKGFDEYALRSNFKFQQPMQSFWLDTPERGITIEAPIFVKAENEGWERDRAADVPVFSVAA